jgi:hypothetical protein
MSSDVYQPLDLDAYCNAGPELLAADQPPAVGDQVFHGLPFRIGQGDRTFVAFGTDSSQQACTIAIGARAGSIIVAHRLLGSELMAGAPVGEAVATYVIRLADGAEYRLPIRERFEIADLVGFGQQPFLAWPDHKHALKERWVGPWSQAGERQT